MNNKTIEKIFNPENLDQIKEQLKKENDVVIKYNKRDDTIKIFSQSVKKIKF